jgi:hypothetical protein
MPDSGFYDSSCPSFLAKLSNACSCYFLEFLQLASLVAPDAARNTATTTAAATPTNKHGDDDEEERAKTARACLALCENPNCYLPFAATGINFAAWIGKDGDKKGSINCASVVEQLWKYSINRYFFLLLSFSCFFYHH